MSLLAGKHARYLWLFKEVLPQLRQNFQFHEYLVQHVQNFKRQIQSEFLKKVIFVGVHCRRTDFVNILEKKGTSTYVKHYFYEKAFDIYRAKYNDENTKVIFLSVSDDTKWIKVMVFIFI